MLRHCDDSLTQVFCCRNRDRDRSPRKERDRDRDRDRRDRERRHRDRDKGGDRERREVTLTCALWIWRNDAKHWPTGLAGFQLATSFGHTLRAVASTYVYFERDRKPFTARPNLSYRKTIAVHSSFFPASLVKLHSKPGKNPCLLSGFELRWGLIKLETT